MASTTSARATNAPRRLARSMSPSPRRRLASKCQAATTQAAATHAANDIDTIKKTTRAPARALSCSGRVDEKGESLILGQIRRGGGDLKQISGLEWSKVIRPYLNSLNVYESCCMSGISPGRTHNRSDPSLGYRLWYVTEPNVPRIGYLKERLRT
jgi:hypothetical protein